MDDKKIINKNYQHLLTPWKIGNVEIKNRFVMTSMGGTSLFGWMEPNHFDQEAANFILERAKNNVGLILPGIAPIKDILFGKWLYQGKKKFRKLKNFMEEYHKTGAKLFVQITAGFGRSLAINNIMIKAMKHKVLGFFLRPFLNVSYLTASASKSPNRWDDSVYSRALTTKEIKKIVDAFAKTSKLLKAAGVDGVEVHAVHEGYLIDQFTLRYVNHRMDKYGGSFENRYRFPVDIVKAIKKECGNDFPVSLRYSVLSKTKAFGVGALPNETYKEIGRDMAESERAAKYLEEAGYDMLNCDNGTYDAWYWSHPPGYMPQNCNLEDVAHIKKMVNIPVVCAGRMTSSVAEQAIMDGKLDAMGVARQFLADTAWITKMLQGRIDDIRPCICCHNACFNMAHYKGVGNAQSLADNAGMARCALNPETMQSKKYFIETAKNRKNIAIIGGGIGGMEVARVATLRGHNVVIYEKTNRLGGVFNAAAAPSFKEKDKALLSWYANEMKKLSIQINFSSEIKDISTIKADEIVIATGSRPRMLHCKGNEQAIEACEYLLNEKSVGAKVIVVGGGLTGCEIAYDLYLKGKTPIIVEMKNDLIATSGVCLANSSYLRDFFALHQVEIHLLSQLDAITSTGVIISDNKGNKLTIEADSVISSIGYIPTPITREKRKNIHFVGDCSAIGNLRTVIW